MEIELEKEEKEEAIESSQDDSKLTLQQKIILFVSGFIIYLLFLILLFPYSQFIRYYLGKNIIDVKIDYSELIGGIISPTRIKEFYVSSNQFNFNGDEIILKINLLELIKQKIITNLFLDKGYLQYNEFRGNLFNLNFEINLDHFITRPLSEWTGSLNLQLKSLQLEKSFGLLKPIITDPSQLEIKNLNTKIIIEKGNFKITKLEFDSALFKVNLIANGSLKNQLETSSIKGEICLIPAQNLEEINPTIYNFYITAGGSSGGKLCLKIDGTFNQPKFEP